jgi:hypothetical protein
MTEEIRQEAELNAQDRLPWHKPEVQRLTVSLDTRNAKGSGEDSETHGLLFG